MPTFTVETKSTFFSDIKNAVLATPKDKCNFAYFIVLLLFTLYEFMISQDCNSLGMLISTVHNGFCLLSIIINYAVKIYSAKPSTDRYSYGFLRVEPFLGFINGIFLILCSAYTLMQCVERMIEPAEIPTTPEIVSTILKTLLSGLIVKVIGIAFFSDIIFVRDSSSLSTAIPKTQKRFAIFQFIQDFVVIFVFFISYYKKEIVEYDGYFAFAMALVVVYVAIPILIENGLILLQTSPQNAYPQIYAKLQQLHQIDGVVEYKNEHFWTLAPNKHVGSIIVIINEDADEQIILKQAHEILDTILVDICIQVQKRN